MESFASNRTVRSRQLLIETFLRWIKSQSNSGNVKSLNDLSELTHINDLLNSLSGGRFNVFRRRHKHTTPSKLQIVIKFLKHEKIPLPNEKKVVKLLSEGGEDILEFLELLLLHYNILVPLNVKDKCHVDPRYELLKWINERLTSTFRKTQTEEKCVSNFGSDWRDGICLGALVNSFSKELCWDWFKWDHENGVGNIMMAMIAAETNLPKVKRLLEPSDMCHRGTREICIIAYLAQFVNAKIIEEVYLSDIYNCIPVYNGASKPQRPPPVLPKREPLTAKQSPSCRSDENETLPKTLCITYSTDIAKEPTSTEQCVRPEDNPKRSFEPRFSLKSCSTYNPEVNRQSTDAITLRDAEKETDQNVVQTDPVTIYRPASRINDFPVERIDRDIVNYSSQSCMCGKDTRVYSKPTPVITNSEDMGWYEEVDNFIYPNIKCRRTTRPSDYGYHNRDIGVSECTRAVPSVPDVSRVHKDCSSFNRTIDGPTYQPNTGDRISAIGRYEDEPYTMFIDANGDMMKHGHHKGVRSGIYTEQTSSVHSPRGQNSINYNYNGRTYAANPSTAISMKCGRQSTQTAAFGTVERMKPYLYSEGCCQIQRTVTRPRLSLNDEIYHGGLMNGILKDIWETLDHNSKRLLGEVYLPDLRMEVSERTIQVGSFGVLRKVRCSMQNKLDMYLAKSVNVTTENIALVTAFLNDAFNCIRLEHKNVVKIVAVTLENNVIYALLPCPELRNLQEYLLNNQQLRREDHLGIVLDVASGMDYISRLDYVLQLLTTTSCLIGRDETVKIGDLSEMKDTIHDGCTKSTVDKDVNYRHLAPEVFGSGECGKASDVYAFGLLFWSVMKFGEEPFSAVTNAYELCGRLHSGQKLQQTPIDSDDYQLMSECWEIKEEKRPTFSEIVHRVENLCQSAHYTSVDENQQLVSVARDDIHYVTSPLLMEDGSIPPYAVKQNVRELGLHQVRSDVNSANLSGLGTNIRRPGRIAGDQQKDNRNNHIASCENILEYAPNICKPQSINHRCLYLGEHANNKTRHCSSQRPIDCDTFSAVRGVSTGENSI